MFPPAWERLVTFTHYRRNSRSRTLTVPLALGLFDGTDQIGLHSGLIFFFVLNVF